MVVHFCHHLSDLHVVLTDSISFFTKMIYMCKIQVRKMKYLNTFISNGSLSLLRFIGHRYLLTQAFYKFFGKKMELYYIINMVISYCKEVSLDLLYAYFTSSMPLRRFSSASVCLFFFFFTEKRPMMMITCYTANTGIAKPVKMTVYIKLYTL